MYDVRQLVMNFLSSWGSNRRPLSSCDLSKLHNPLTIHFSKSSLIIVTMSVLYFEGMLLLRFIRPTCRNLADIIECINDRTETSYAKLIIEHQALGTSGRSER